MKRILILLALLAALGFTFSACGGSTASQPKIEKATDVNGPEYRSRFLCPMRCKGSGNAQPGKCPACKMDYVANAHFGHNHGPGGHGHGHDHGHNHDHDHNH